MLVIQRLDDHRSIDHMTTGFRPCVHEVVKASAQWPLMAELRNLIPRRAEALVREALSDTRVVLLNGARQSGKSTLTRLTAASSPGALVRLLDDPATLRSATDDPTEFVEHDGLLVIDEIQIAPELLRPIKVAVDLDPTPGRYLLTGSSRLLAMRTLPDALLGRMEIIELWPFSQGEIDGEPDGFVDAVFAHGPKISHSSTLRRRDYLGTSSGEDSLRPFAACRGVEPPSSTRTFQR